MTSVVDTNVLIDILSGSPAEIHAAENAVRVAGRQGRLWLPTICYAELAGRFKNRRDLDSFLGIMPVTLMALNADAGFLAGAFHQEYRQRGGTRTRMLADFIVAAQAQLGADRLLTTDKRFFGTSFPKLVSVSPADLLP
jgi:predicted nucleic acid-binding protein